MAVLKISARALGKRKPLVPDRKVPWPQEEHDSGEPLTLIDTHVVKSHGADGGGAVGANGEPGHNVASHEN